MHAVHNARIMLLANLLNGMAGSSFTVGVAAPIVAAFFYTPAGLHPLSVALEAIVWIVIAGVLHVLAQRVLGRLRE